MLNENVPLPLDILSTLPGSENVMDHSVSVDGARWRREITSRELPPIAGKLSEEDRTTLTRREVFEIGDLEQTPENAFQLLYYSLAWGLGMRASRLSTRLDHLASSSEEASKLLVEAWTSVRTSSSTSVAYRTLTTDKGAGRIPQLGPAFATKFLYFAQGPTSEPRHLILDEVVATNLQRDAWPDSPPAAWWPETYERYCSLLARWAVEASEDPQVGRTVRADEIEMALFTRK